MKKLYAPTSSGLLKPIEHWFNDPSVSEILLNKPYEIFVEKKGEMHQVEIPEYNERMLNNLFRLIANENKQEFDAVKPLLSGSLLDGSRIQLVMPPTSVYPTFSIRRQVVRDFTLDAYKDLDYYRSMIPCNINQEAYEDMSDTEKVLINHYHNKNWDSFIRDAIIAKKNIVISGGTSSGKTTFLNACLRHIPIDDRIIILEDTREIKTPHINQVNLLASKGDQGLAKVSMQDLVQCCLRLRPDRIIMGEIRGAEIMDFVSACSTGHEGSLTTIHANNPKVAFMRMTQMYKQNNVPSMTDQDIMRELKEVIDIVIQINKTPEGRLASSIYYKHMDVQPKGI